MLELGSLWKCGQTKKEEQRKRISEAVDRNAASIPLECRIEPTFGEVRAIVNGLEGCIDEELLENGFINLLEASMDSRRASGLIKNYAVVLNQLCPDEAKILSYVFSVRTNLRVLGRIDANAASIAVKRQAFVLGVECEVLAFHPEGDVLGRVGGLREVQLCQVRVDSDVHAHFGECLSCADGHGGKDGGNRCGGFGKAMRVEHERPLCWQWVREESPIPNISKTAACVQKFLILYIAS